MGHGLMLLWSTELMNVTKEVTRYIQNGFTIQLIV